MKAKNASAFLEIYKRLLGNLNITVAASQKRRCKRYKRLFGSINIDLECL